MSARKRSRATAFRMAGAVSPVFKSLLDGRVICRVTLLYNDGCIRSSSSPTYSRQNKIEMNFWQFEKWIVSLTWFNAGNTSRTISADGVPMMLLNRCSPNFFVKSPERFNRLRIYWPHKHLPCVTKSCVGITAGNFHPIVLDSLRVTTSLTLLKRRRADNVLVSLSRDDECNATGKLNLRLFSMTGNRSIDFVADGIGVADLGFGKPAPAGFARILSIESMFSVSALFYYTVVAYLKQWTNKHWFFSRENEEINNNKISTKNYNEMNWLICIILWIVFFCSQFDVRFIN